MSTIYTSAEEAEDAFYEAIGRGDIDAIMQVWSDEEEIVCIHPTGQRLTGSTAIRESWQTIFSTNANLTVHAQRVICWQSAIIAVHSVTEVLFVGDDPTPHGPVLSTNVFQRGANGWRLISRHTSTGVEGSHEAALGESASSSGRTLH
jgi:ketosteroid isomerase-like protein